VNGENSRARGVGTDGLGSNLEMSDDEQLTDKGMCFFANLEMPDD
jgi:hypothetical protein